MLVLLLLFLLLCPFFSWFTIFIVGGVWLLWRTMVEEGYSHQPRYQQFLGRPQR